MPKKAKKQKVITNEELVKKYGPFKEIGRDRESVLLAEGKYRHIFTIKGEDSDEHEDGYVMHAHVGHGLVNVDVVFEATKAMPEDLEIQDFWFDEHLEAP